MSPDYASYAICLHAEAPEATVPVKRPIFHFVHFESEKVPSDILIGAECHALQRVVKDDGGRAAICGACHHVQGEEMLLPRMGKPSVRRPLPAYEPCLLLLRLRSDRLLQIVIELLRQKQTQSVFCRWPFT